ncbi:MAG: hypothetical protein KDB07_11435 [Planctomycetes bacterium]|nr:hypothetical protein [Planctomycetota bacterium]
MTEPSRKREVITATVEDSRIGKTIITAYNGLLPEEALLLLMEQNITLRLRGNSSRTSRENVWHAMSEDVQNVLVRGIAGAPVETT